VHEQFDDRLDRLMERSGVGQEVLGEVLARTSLRAPEETSRVEISAGNPTARRAVDQRGIPQGTVSKAVRALMEEGLLEEGERYLKSPDGRTVAPLRFGRGFAIAGVKVVQQMGRPRAATTALVGLDGSTLLDVRHEAVADSGGDGWKQISELICRQVTELKIRCDEARETRGLPPLQLFGVGVEVGAPVYNGRVMPLIHETALQPVDLSTDLRALLETSDSVEHSVPVVVENDVNALAVLAIHEIRFVDTDLVVVSVFDEGVGGGLVMDGRVRRGGNGKAMEIGHLAVGYPPGQERGPTQPRDERDDKPRGIDQFVKDPGFDDPCQCGHFGHVDTLAPPARIRGELGISVIDGACELSSDDAGFSETRNVFARSGSALGRALAHVSNTVNPSRLIVYMPAALANARSGSAAAAYLDGVRDEVAGAFAAGRNPDYIAIRPQPAEPDGVAVLGARSAAICVLESFIEHALRLDGCTSGLRRTSSRLATARRAPEHRPLWEPADVAVR
jgi:predicted NBD/HSP70 family sugar kinase